MPTEEQISQAADWFLEANRVMALTGAGISAESGIPTFRGVQGLWEKYDIMEYAHIDAFRSDPAKVWTMLLELDRTMETARPNPAHQALARLEQMGLCHLVVTQNVDNLHQTAGSADVVEFHGNARRMRCLDCREEHDRSGLDFADLPLRCACGGLIKPDVVFFGERIPWAASVKAFETAKTVDLMLVIGTSALVSPASEIPLIAKHAGARVLEINLEPTVLSDRVSDLSLFGPAGDVLGRVVEAVQRRRQ